jgi:hypothetical protein
MASGYYEGLYRERVGQTHRIRHTAPLSSSVNTFLQESSDRILDRLCEVGQSLERWGTSIHEEIHGFPNLFRSSVRVPFAFGIELRIPRKPFESLGITEEIEEAISYFTS